jgi:ABC-type cobalamin/Fe3+-siderophores transport system ATPase subunit
MLNFHQYKLFTPLKDSEILKDSNVAFPDKGLYLILGKNGIGKTTFLKSLCGWHHQFEGKITWDGKDLNKISLMEKRDLVQYASEPFPLPAFLNLIDYITLGYNRNEQRLQKVMNEFNIEGLSNKMVLEMSKGQQQKSMLAKLIYSNAKILLLDEPSNYLDFKSQKNLWEILTKESADRLILATIHDPRLVLELEANVLVMSEKRLIPWGPEKRQSELIQLL